VLSKRETALPTEEYAGDFAEADAKQVTTVLDVVLGAWERTQEGLAQG
jgi:hypothetical protein